MVVSFLSVIKTKISTSFSAKDGFIDQFLFQRLFIDQFRSNYNGAKSR